MVVMPLGTQRSIIRELRVLDGPITNDELATKCGYDSRTIQRNLKGLLIAGAITRERVGTPGRRSWRYQYKVIADV